LSYRQTRINRVTATQSPTNEQPTTASDSAERRYATVNPFTGETEKEFPFTETS
jgi:succinate-semialdehyde dehydrogenase/glutarate-semialdehyde dehydrogenase